jgi:putative endonuclease
MAFTYVLYSPSINRLYVGSTNDMEARLKKHNSGYERYTRRGTPWTLLWVTSKSSKGEAMLLESKLKNLNRKRLLELLLKYEKDLRIDPSYIKNMQEGLSQDDAL